MFHAARKRYWHTAKSLKVWADTLIGGDPKFRSVAISDLLIGPESLKPIEGETAERAAAALQWIFRAQDAMSDNGVSYGYFPARVAHGWDISYPETTGYIMTTLIHYARRTRWSEPIDRAYSMALWEADIQMPSGAIQGGKVTKPDKQTAASFNTGMVLDGLVTVLAEKSDPKIRHSAEQAARFLAADLTAEGLFKTNGKFVSKDVVRIYNVLCAWALYRFGVLSGSRTYCDAAIRAVEGALRFHKKNGWFASNCLTDSSRPLTHTIGYTAQGILEVGLAAGREDFVAAAEATWCGVMKNIGANGFLAGRFDESWRPAVRWCCLTGSVQMAIVGYRLFEFRGDSQYRTAANQLVNFVKAVQRTSTGNPGIDGALAGTYPIMGPYMQGGYPNWATKYMLDALMLQADYSKVPLQILPRETSK